MIYLFFDINKFTEHDLYDCHRYISNQRAKKIDSYIHLKDKKLSVIAYLLLRFALYKETGITQKPEFAYGEGKKPYIIGCNKHFNLSHCSMGVMCGVSDYKIGVDIQEKIADFSDIAKYVLSCSESSETEASQKCFTDIWTLKECYGKYTGEGITYSMPDRSFDGNSHGWCEKWGLNFYNENRGEYSFSVCSEVQDDVINVTYEEMMSLLTQIE